MPAHNKRACCTTRHTDGSILQCFDILLFMDCFVPRNDGQHVSSLRGGTTKQPSEKQCFKLFYINGNDKFYHQYSELCNSHKRFGKIGVKVIARTSVRPLTVSDNPNCVQSIPNFAKPPGRYLSFWDSVAVIGRLIVK